MMLSSISTHPAEVKEVTEQKTGFGLFKLSMCAYFPLGKRHISYLGQEGKTHLV